MKHRKLFLLIMVAIFFISNIPPFTLNKASAASQVVKTNIMIPNAVVQKDGVYYLGTERSGELGNIDISTLNLGSDAKITSVQLLTSSGTYVKHLMDHTGTVYRMGTVPSTGSIDVTAKADADVGYFAWWQLESSDKKWAYDLDGVRHYREYTVNTNSPLANGKYLNVLGTGYPVGSYNINGNKPAGYSPSHSNYLKVFDDEKPDKANIGWAERNIPISNTTFRNDTLNISVPVDKLSKVDATVSYITPRRDGAIPEANIIDKIIMDTPETMIANKNVKLWFSAKMGAYGEPSVDNGLKLMTYYNQWKVDLKSKLYKYDTYQVVVYYGDEPGPTPGPTPEGSCSYTISTGGMGTTMSNSTLTASPIGQILSQTGEFDAVQGIPSSEELKTNVSSLEYLFDQSYEQQLGKVVYSVTMTKEFTLNWNEKKPPATPDGKETTEPKSEQVTETVTVEVEKDFSYWTVKKYDVWSIDRAETKNYALPNGESIMKPTMDITAAVEHTPDVESHVIPAPCPDTTLPSEVVNGGDTKPDVPDFEGEAKQEGESRIEPPAVKNDKADFQNSVLMSDEETSGGHGPTPLNIPNPATIMLENNNLLIDPLKTNYWQSPSTGLIYYKGVISVTNTPPSEITFPYAVNNVTVHTPVVIYATATDDKEHDQRINPPLRSTPANSDTDRHAFILDRPFTVTLPTAGQHRNIPGYGYRDYSKYIKNKQVKFPFDVYTETKLGYYPANTWIDVPVNMESVSFYLPVWIPEAQYTVEFRSFAINALDGGDFGGTEAKANITIPNAQYNVPPAGTSSAAHVAITSIEVDVVGRLYDFQVTDIDDYNWKNVFRKANLQHTGNSYYVGLTGIDKQIRGNTKPYVLPISHASNPNGIKNLAVKTGYDFNFNFKTKGDMESLKDAIRIKPSFYFVNTDGTGRREVDLYYHNNDTNFIKIGSSEDQTYRTVKLNETSRNVASNEIVNNAYHYYDNASKFNLEGLASEHTRNSFARHYNKHYSKGSTKTGPYGWQLYNWQLRTYRGPLKETVPTNTMIPSSDIVTKEQTWYGEYSIPANTYVVPKNSKINETGQISKLYDNHPIFLKDGYIIVNFDIETINEGDLANPRLSYFNAHYMSQWSDMEGFQKQFVDRYGKTFTTLEGDVIYYHANQSSLEDFSASITH